jgi:hypothetical protein
MKKKFLLLILMCLSACSATQPENPNNICDIFQENPDWYEYANRAKEKWGAPIHIPMSMMYQESSFKADARPSTYYFLGIIPWGYISSAYGYSQAKTLTWEDYVKETENWGANRDNFADAIDFMGWFVYKTNKINKISKWDGYNQYLNYHEGWGGFQKKTYRNKAWLVKVAKKVDKRAKVYSAQLKKCESNLGKSWLWRIFN